MTGDQQLMSAARRPHQMSRADLATHLEEMVMATFEDLASQFMLVPGVPPSSRTRSSHRTMVLRSGGRGPGRCRSGPCWPPPSPP